MKKYFLDVGAHRGESARLFRTKYDPGCNFVIFSFEANPNLHVEKTTSHIIIKQALWIHGGKVGFYPARSTDGSTLIHGKTTGGVDYELPMIVDAFDVKNLFKSIDEKDFVVMKLNVEGCEYELLPYMIENNIHRKVDVLMVQWHVKKFVDAEPLHDRVKEMTDRSFKHVIELEGAYKDYGDLPTWLPKD